MKKIQTAVLRLDAYGIKMAWLTVILLTLRLEKGSESFGSVCHHFSASLWLGERLLMR